MAIASGLLLKKMENKTCKDRVKGALKSRMEDLRTLNEADNFETEELGNLGDYGLCIDFVPEGTFDNQREPYARYQISYGGPSEEFRIYGNGDVEFWFLDWFDGGGELLDGDDAALIKEIVFQGESWDSWTAQRREEAKE